MKGPETETQFAAKENIGGRRQVVAQRQVLVDDLDAVLAGFHRLVHDEFLVLHAHGAVARPVIAGNHLDEGGLARAVVAHQSHDLARRQRQRNVIDGLNCAEML